MDKAISELLRMQIGVDVYALGVDREKRDKSMMLNELLRHEERLPEDDVRRTKLILNRHVKYTIKKYDKLSHF